MERALSYARVGYFSHTYRKASTTSPSHVLHVGTHTGILAVHSARMLRSLSDTYHTHRKSTVTGYERYKFAARLAAGICQKSDFIQKKSTEEPAEIRLTVFSKKLEDIVVGQVDGIRDPPTLCVIDDFDCGLIGLCTVLNL